MLDIGNLMMVPGDVLTDISGYGNNGTIYGATWSEDVPSEPQPL